MRRAVFAFCAALSAAAFANEVKGELPLRLGDESEAAKAERLAWWTHDRFGMFIHFGLYAMPARHEWVRSYEAIDNETYDAKYFPRFDPDLFDAREWARAAVAAGMKYVVLTTKHHEGFCLWDTATTDYKITNTPFGRDLVKEFVEACRAEGLKVGFYFSLIDWHHPDYTVDVHHPLFTRLDKAGVKGEELKAEVEKLNGDRDMERYRAFLFAQVRELLTNYGKIDIIWFDFTPAHPVFGKTYRDWNAVELLKMARTLQPGIIVDDRLGLKETDDGWDFTTPEQVVVTAHPKVRGKPAYWETCQTFSGSWGYHRDQKSWKSVPQLLELLIRSVAFGGNLIMNVGPTGRGDFDYRAKERLAGYEKWMKHNSRSIYGCGEAPADLTASEGTLLTYNPETKRLYIHLLVYPEKALQTLFMDKVAYAQFLHDGSEILFDADGFRLPKEKPPVEIPVIEIWLKDTPDDFKVQTIKGKED